MPPGVGHHATLLRVDPHVPCVYNAGMEESQEINQFEIAARMRKVIALCEEARLAGACREDLVMFNDEDWNNLARSAGVHVPSAKSRLAVLAMMPTESEMAADVEEAGKLVEDVSANMELLSGLGDRDVFEGLS